MLNSPELQEALPENDRATAGAILAVGPSDNLGGDCQYKQLSVKMRTKWMAVQ